MNNKLNPNETALIIVDMQNDFCHEDGACGQNGLVDLQAFQACVEPIQHLIDQARASGVPVLFVKMTLDESTISDAWRLRQGTGSGMRIVEKGSWGTEFYKLQPQEGDYIIEKHRYSAFIGTNLDLILRSLNRKSIVLTGVLTNVCVESTARDGFMLDYNVTLVNDGCAGSSPEVHEASMANLGQFFGQVLQADEVASYWSAAPAAAGVLQR